MALQALVLLALAVGVVAGTPPKMPKEFLCEEVHMRAAGYLNVGPYALSSTKSLARQDMYTVDPALPGVRQNKSAYYVPDGFYMYQNGECKKSSMGHYWDMFGWVSEAAMVGKGRYHGVDCTLWGLTTSENNMTLCAAGDNNPQFVEITFTSFPYSLSFEFMAPLQLTIPEGYLSLPAVCTAPPLVCGSPDVVRETVYIFHPNTTTGDIASQNVADLLGDTYFVCHDLLANHTAIDKYQWVSQYEIELWGEWGDYQECNGYPPQCVGPNDRLVGRESPMCLTQYCGQCSNNSATGTWYSLPAKTQCHVTPYSRDCTWRTLRRVKTIDGMCLVKSHLLQACQEHPAFPMPQATAIFRAAFTEDLPSRGGCPRVI